MPAATPNQAEPIASLPPLVGVIAVSLASSLALAWGVAQAQGWNQRVQDVSLEVSALLGVAAVAIGALPGLALLRSPSARTARNLGMRVLAAGSARLMTSLSLGVTLLMVVKPEGFSFFAALTLAAVGCMLGEVAWGVSALRRHATGDDAHATTHSISSGATTR